MKNINFKWLAVLLVALLPQFAFADVDGTVNGVSYTFRNDGQVNS